MNTPKNTICRATDNCGEARNNLRLDAAIIQVCREIYPLKPVHHIADLTGYPLRTVEYIFAGGKMPADMLGRLIRSDHGRQFLAAVMGDVKPSWWKRLRSMFSVLDAMQSQRAAERLLKEAFDVENSVEEAVQRATRILSDKNMDSQQDTERRSLGRLGNFAVVAK